MSEIVSSALDRSVTLEQVCYTYFFSLYGIITITTATTLHFVDLKFVRKWPIK
jgi:hypothetical protein